MKVLFATPHLFPDVVGGSGLHSLHLIRHLAMAGHELDVLHPYATVHFAQFPHVQEYTVPFGRTVMDFAEHVNRWVGSRQYDLGYSDGLSLARYVKRKSFPIVVNDHGLLQFQPQYFGDYLRTTPLPALKDLLFYWPRIRARTRLARQADYVVSMGGKMDGLVEDHLRIPTPRILQLPNAVDDGAAVWPQTEPGDPGLFLFVGKIEFRKGVGQLLQAFQQLQHTGARLRLVGDGPMVPRCGAAVCPMWNGPARSLAPHCKRNTRWRALSFFPLCRKACPRRSWRPWLMADRSLPRMSGPIDSWSRRQPACCWSPMTVKPFCERYRK